MSKSDDLISRQAALDAIRASASKYTGFMEMEQYTDDDAVEAIEGVPSVQPERKKGRWKYMLRDSENDEYRCSVCSYPSGYNYDYCPHCGAMMLKGDSND